MQFEGAGAHHWLSGHRNELAHGICNRVLEDDRSSNRKILSEAQPCLNNVLSASGFSAYQMVFGSNPMVLLRWEDKDEDLMLAQDTSLEGQFAQ